VPAPADVQTANGAATVGRAETGDTVLFTFAGALDPSTILASWDGSSTTVIVHFEHQGGISTLSIEDSAGTPLAALGSVDLADHYANTLDFTGSTMTASGSTITVALGAEGAGGILTNSIPTTMVWTAPTGSASESGLPDVEF
jgi:hypothetical protein